MDICYLEHHDIMQVQARHYFCADGIACNCAVAVREDNIVLGIDNCNTPTPKTTPLLVQYLGEENDGLNGASIKQVKSITWDVSNGNNL